MFKKDPLKKLNDEYTKILTQATERQRNGDIEGYSRLSQQATDVLEQIKSLEDQR